MPFSSKQPPEDRKRNTGRNPSNFEQDGWITTNKTRKANYRDDASKLQFKPAQFDTIQCEPIKGFFNRGRGSSGPTKPTAGTEKASILSNRYSALADHQMPARQRYDDRGNIQRSAASSQESSRGRNNQLPPQSFRKTLSTSKERENGLGALSRFTRSGQPEPKPIEPKVPNVTSVNGKGAAATSLKGPELSEEDIEKKTKPLMDGFLHNDDFKNDQTRNNPQIANMSRPPMGNLVQHGSQQGSQNYRTLQVLSSHGPHQGYPQVYTVPQMISFQQRGVQYPTNPMQHYQHMYTNPYAAYNPSPANNPAYLHQMQPHLTSCPPAVNSMPPPPAQHHHRIEKKMLAIINPDTGKNIMEDYDDSSRDSSRPASLQTSRESSRTGSVSDPAVCSLFAAQVAATSVAPKTETVESEPKSIRDSQPIIMQPESLVVLETPNDSGADKIPAPINCDQFVGKEPTLELENSDISKTNRLESNVIRDNIPITGESNADISFVEPAVKESCKLTNHDSFNPLEKSPPREGYCVPSLDKIEESIVLPEIAEIPDQAQHSEVINSIVEDKVVSEPIVNSVDETANAGEQIDAVTPGCPPSPSEAQTGDKVTKNSAALKAEKTSEDRWSPLNVMRNKHYTREFLLQMRSHPMSLKKPTNLPNLEIIKEMAQVCKLSDMNQTPITPMQTRIFDPSMRSYARSGPSRPEVYKKFQGILNKLTPQRFDALVKQVKDLEINSEEGLKTVIDSIYEKAIDKPNCSVPYASVCKQLAPLRVPFAEREGYVNFRILLLTKCREEFQRDGRSKLKKIEKMKLIEDATDAKKKQLTKEFEEEERTNRRRQLGNFRFMGELFKSGMLTETIMYVCISRLLRQGDEDSLECLCCLLTTIGKELETQKEKVSQEEFNTKKDIMNEYMNEIQKIVNKRQTNSRIRFVLQYVIDLRKNMWKSRRNYDNPITIDQMPQKAEREAHEQQQLLQNMPFSNKRPPDDRKLDTGQNPSNFERDGWIMTNKTSKVNYSVDASKLQCKEVYKKMQAILNEINSQNFDILIKQVKDLEINSEETLTTIVDLVFECATNESKINSITIYARMCKQLTLILKVPLAEKEGYIDFQRLLLTKCQKEFDQDSHDELKTIEKIKLIEDPIDEKEEQLTERFEDEVSKKHKRKLGNIRFIGELFNFNVFTELVMHKYIVKLLRQRQELSLECLCCLLKIIGKELESGKEKMPQDKFNSRKDIMDEYINEMKKIVIKCQASSRVQNLLQDVIDLRKNNLELRNTDKPKTINQRKISVDECKEVESEEHKQQLLQDTPSSNVQPPDDVERNTVTLNQVSGTLHNQEISWMSII